MNHDEKCKEIQDEADLDLLARLTDEEEITIEWAESQGWEKRGDCLIKSIQRDSSTIRWYHMLDESFQVFSSISNDRFFLGDELIAVKSRGQLLCLMRGLGGSV